MSTLSPDQWRVLSPYLDEALTLPATKREAWLAAIRAKDPSLAAQLQGLLNEHHVLEQKDYLGNSPEISEVRQGLAGQNVGPYRLISQIGEGGMGAVWLAERSDGRFERKAAVKFLSASLVGRGGEERFKREGSILGRLSHPNIAELLDAGVTSSGQPYIVLEYVEGEPIDQYCDDRALDVEARVRLFLDVLGAVAHAHSNLIVHRDIKPSNVLIRNDGQVKLLDFGIAKLLEGQGQEGVATLLTHEVGAAMTPLYAAPEQMTGGGVTTATDVYGLGILFYKLLTGQHPAGPGPYSTADLVKAIVDTEARRMSETVAANPDTDSKTSNFAKRSTTQDKLRRALRGDLDTIAAKALKKDPALRYASVTPMADDLGRYLRHEPISARRDTVAYRAAKFIRRNRFSFSAAVLAGAAIIAGSAAAIYQARLAQRRFQDVRNLAHTFVFDLHDEIAKLEGSTKAREMMVQTGLQYLDSLAENTGSDLELQNEIAAAYMKIGDAQGYPTRPNLGRITDALASYRKAGVIYERISAKNDVYLPDLAVYYRNYAGLVRYSHDLKQAKDLAQVAIQTFDRVRAYHPLNAQSENDYTWSWCTVGDIDEDEGNYHQAWTEFSRCGGLAHAQLNRGRDLQALLAVSRAEERIGTAAQELGLLQDSLKAFDEDETVLRELLAAEPLNPRFNRARALMYQFRARVYFDNRYPSLEDPARALESIKHYLEAAQEMVKRDPNNTSARLSLAIAASHVSFSLCEFDPRAAIRMASDSVRRFDEMMSTGNGDHLVVSNRASSLWVLGLAQLKADRRAEAHDTAEKALSAFREITAQTPRGSRDRVELVSALILAGQTNARVGNLAHAESLLQEAREEAKVIASPEELSSLIPLANSEEALATYYLRRNRAQEARACYQRLVDLWQGVRESSEYVDRQRTTSGRLLASVR